MYHENIVEVSQQEGLASSPPDPAVRP